MKKDIQIMIIPDVHGRTFWKDAVAAHPDAQVVFLGDYLDQYAWEGITDSETLAVFMDLLALKRSRPDTVHLLLGNHDMAYVDAEICCGRHKWLDEAKLRRLYLDSIDCFGVAYGAEIAGKRFLFSHAGVTRGWYGQHRDLFTRDIPDAGMFDDLFFDKDRRYDLIVALSDVSKARWGGCDYGSMIWADDSESLLPEAQIPGLVQIFGHSQQDVEPCCLRDRAYCLDCRKVFYIDSRGDVRYYDDDRIVGDDRYLFLDIDGVVTSERSDYRFDPVCFERLGRILDATDARIVITSSWKGQTVKETIRHLTETRDPYVGDHPFPFCDRIVGVTRDWPVVDDDFTRGKEVDAYLRPHSCRSYAIIDDIQDFLPDQQDHYVWTRDRDGITEEDAAMAIDILLK